MMPKFIIKGMENIFAEEQKQIIKQLMMNLEQFPVAKTGSDGKNALYKMKRFVHVYKFTVRLILGDDLLSSFVIIHDCSLRLSFIIVPRAKKNSTFIHLQVWRKLLTTINF